MSNEKLEGTIVFEGMLQGRMPDIPEFPDQLREWVAFMQGLGVAFHADISDNGFSLLPEPEPASVAKLGDPPETTISTAIEQLLEQYPLNDPAQLSSTLRSREYRPNEEVQTFYGIAGRLVKPQTRTVEAQTVAPPAPITTKQRVQMGLTGLAIALCMMGIALLFPGVRSMISSIFETVRPVDLSEVKVDVGPYAAYLTAVKDEQKSSWAKLQLTLTRTKQFPTDDASLKTAMSEAGENPRQRRALESLVIDGYIRLELFDPDGNFLTHMDYRVTDLNSQKSLDMAIPFPSGVRVARIVFVP